MAGLWDRLIPGDDAVPVHLMRAAIVLAREGTFTNAQILAGLNASIGAPLDSAAQTDLVDIKAQALVGSVQQQLVYTEVFESLCLVTQLGLLTNEATWRSKLGI